MKPLRWTSPEGELVIAKPFLRDGAPHVTLEVSGKAVTMRVTPFVLKLIGKKLSQRVIA